MRGLMSKVMPFAWASTTCHFGPREVVPSKRCLGWHLTLPIYARRAPSIAAAWFTMCGCDVLFPIEPAVYDLVVSMPEVSAARPGQDDDIQDVHRLAGRHQPPPALR